MTSPSITIVALSAILIGCGPRAQPELHLLPHGYVGRVYIVFSVPSAAPTAIDEGMRVYRIPASGILVTATEANPGWGWKGDTAYAYVDGDGRRTPIMGRWYSTIHDTVEARQDKTVGISGAGLGTGAVPGLKCELTYQSYFVGRQADALDNKSPDLELDVLCAAAGYDGVPLRTRT